MNIASVAPHPALATAGLTSVVDFLRSAFQAGLSDTQLATMAALAEDLVVSGDAASGETTVRLSRYDVARRTGLSLTQVQRALCRLVEGGFVHRRQLAKKDGEIAQTMLTEKALRLFGVKGGASVETNVPAELANLLIGESAEVVAGVLRAWRDLDMPGTDVAREFRGGERRWVQIEFLLRARMEIEIEAVAVAQADADAVTAREEAGEFDLELPDGDVVVLCNQPWRDVEGRDKSALRAADMRFVRETLRQLVRKSPSLVSRSSLPRLVAEIAFSRASGFVFDRDAAEAVRILASCVAKPSWQRPWKMSPDWYSVSRRCLRAQAFTQGDRFRVS